MAVHVVAPTDHPKSARNRCVIEVLGGVLAKFLLPVLEAQPSHSLPIAQYRVFPASRVSLYREARGDRLTHCITSAF